MLMFCKTSLARSSSLKVTSPNLTLVTSFLKTEFSWKSKGQYLHVTEVGFFPDFIVVLAW